MSETIKYRVIIEKRVIRETVEKVWRKFHDLQDFDKAVNPQYGYVDSKEIKTEAVDIYSQMFESTLDVEKVIAAANSSLVYKSSG